jgi:polyisoprenoid-binding protein YceI
LASDDFFASEQYPEALFVINSVEASGKNTYDVKGDLTIKGITRPITFGVILNTSGDTLTALGKIIVDRTRYGMKFRSGNFFKNLGDTLINDDFDLNISITAKAISEPALG